MYPGETYLNISKGCGWLLFLFVVGLLSFTTGPRNCLPLDHGQWDALFVCLFVWRLLDSHLLAVRLFLMVNSVCNPPHLLSAKPATFHRTQSCGESVPTERVRERERQREREAETERHRELVSWYFEQSQPSRVTSWLDTERERERDRELAG